MDPLFANSVHEMLYFSIFFYITVAKVIQLPIIFDS